ncbi:hypothetical protein [Catellatospora tritici]|uniref:hypothetical protein n=1 Tax=Catellatospora tritici TaxID=2851566 RepID=UPI001C2DEFEF|nr:hypothetical protein [Catellatospora tritici]MBV1851893.1 hypothetical protein [Catellatospora tritici]
MTSQLDLFTGAPVVQAPQPAPVVRRALPELALGEVRYRSFGGQRDCDDCWSAQSAAIAAGVPVPLRRRATSVRETFTTKTHLCKPHELDRQEWER